MPSAPPRQRRRARALPALLLACAAGGARAGYLLPTDGRDIPLNSTLGAQLLANASHAAPFYQLVNHFVTQARAEDRTEHAPACTHSCVCASLTLFRAPLALPLPLPQSNQAFCSVATAVMMLNALGAYGLPAPTAAALAPFAYFTQETVFSGSCVRSVPTHTGGPLDARFVASRGATLQEWVRPARARAVAGRCGAALSRCGEPGLFARAR